MYFANPWGLLALLALPVIAVIHLYHRRFPVLVVAGLHLWEDESERRSAGRRLDRLPITATLLLELLAALLLALLLSQPRLGLWGSATHLVVVLDDSASMQSQGSDGTRFSERAVAELERRMSWFSRRSVVTVLLTGRRPVMLAGPAVRWSEAKPKLEAWRPSAAAHDFQTTWDRAAQFAGESDSLLFLTDQWPVRTAAVAPQEAVPPAPPRDMEVVALGEPLENVALTAARWTRDSATGSGSVFMRVENLGNREAQVSVTGRARERVVFEEMATLAAGMGKSLEMTVPGGLGELTVAMTPADALDIDNMVTLIEPTPRVVKVANTLPADEPAGRLTRRVLDQLPDVQISDAGAAHLLVGRASELPPSRADLWWLGMGPVDAAATAEAVDLAGPYLIDKRHPLLDGVLLSGVVWGGVQPLSLELTPLISAGDHILLGQLNGTRTTGYLMNIDLDRSNIGESPDWPILLSNLVATRRDNLPGLRRWNYRQGEEIQFRLFEGEDQPDPAPLRLVHGEAARPLARAQFVQLPPLEETGIFEVRDGEELVGRFAVNFLDAVESDLTTLNVARREPPPPLEDREPFRLDNPYSWLILLGLAGILVVALLDWRVLRRS